MNIWKKGAQYWDKPWNPVIGCVPVSEGCEHCYAKRVVERFGMNGGDFSPCYKNSNPPQKGIVFVGNMTDLFGEWNSREQIRHWLAKLSRSAVNLVLTKRAERMAEVIYPGAELPHIWWGVTAENQERAEERIPHLLTVKPLGIKSEVLRINRWLSLEPLLGPIKLSEVWGGEYFCPVCCNHFDIPEKWITPCCGAESNGGDDYNCPECGQLFADDEEIPRCPVCWNTGGDGRHRQPDFRECFRAEERLRNIDWVVVGAESGQEARPCKIEWIEQIVSQCQAANVPVFVKQIHLNGKLVKDIEQFPPHLRIRQVPWEV